MENENTQKTDIKKQFRKALIALLDDENGISSNGYEELREFAMDFDPGANNDIFDMVDSSEGRFYLPEDHGLTA